jgi:hypothetical protein
VSRSHRDSLKEGNDLNIDERIILKWISKK